MATKDTLHNKMRIWHRYLGFFLAGIMAVYAFSGVIMIFRTTDFLKKEVHEVRTVEANLSDKKLGEILKIRDLRFENSNGEIQHFKQGTYNSETGTADFTVKKYPFIIEKLTRLHKATVKEPLFFLNIFFGLSLLFFCTVVFLYVYARHRHFQKRYVFYFGRNCAYIDYAVCIKPVGLTTFRKLSNLKSLYLAKFRNAPNIK